GRARLERERPAAKLHSISRNRAHQSQAQKSPVAQNQWAIHLIGKFDLHMPEPFLRKPCSLREGLGAQSPSTERLPLHSERADLLEDTRMTKCLVDRSSRSGLLLLPLLPAFGLLLLSARLDAPAGRQLREHQGRHGSETLRGLTVATEHHGGAIHSGKGTVCRLFGLWILRYQPIKGPSEVLARDVCSRRQFDHKSPQLEVSMLMTDRGQRYQSKPLVSLCRLPIGERSAEEALHLLRHLLPGKRIGQAPRGRISNGFHDACHISKGQT